MTRIAFVGKGGSGKTTLAALFSRFLGVQQRVVLAIDADINQHLGEAPGLSAGEAFASGLFTRFDLRVCLILGIFALSDGKCARLRRAKD